MEHNQLPGYVRRVVDDELDELMGGVPAIALEGPRAVGKTRTALERAATVHRLDDRAVRTAIIADPRLVTRGARPVVIDEWQVVPDVWDVIRTHVDSDRTPGQFLLTGSAVPKQAPVHPGSGRIVSLEMRSMTLAERGLAVPTVSVGDLLAGGRPALGGEADIGARRYAAEILGSGFPGLHESAARAVRAQLDGYVTRIIERDFEELGGERLRNPAALRRWLRAYAGAISSTASYETIRDAATGGHDEKPARTTVQRYLDVLERLWMIEPIPAWTPARNPFSRLAQSPKHALTDPALAGRLLGVTVETLIDGSAPEPLVRDGTLFGALFEAQVAHDLRVYARRHEAGVGHFRLRDGIREIDVVVERPDGRVLAVEVKLARTVVDEDVRHLRWLGEHLGEQLLDAIVVSTGPRAYRRPDGIGVVPAALLGA